MEFDVLLDSYSLVVTAILGSVVLAVLFIFQKGQVQHVQEKEQKLLSVEDCNFLKLYLLGVRIGTSAVRHFFNSRISDKDLPGHLARHQKTLQYILTPEQRKSIQDPNVQTKDFDLSLLYIMIRNTIPNLQPPSPGWGKKPLQIHKLQTDDIEIIRQFRNDLAHNKTFKISPQEFEKSWLEISQAINRLTKGCLNGEILELHQKIFKQSEKSLFEEEIKLIKDKVIELEQDLENCKDRLDETDVRHIPLNVREIHFRILEKWREDDKLFYATRGCGYVYDMIKTNPVVVITGTTGCGKTAMAHHIALDLESEGYEVIPICKIDEIVRYGKPDRDQIFILDNVIGTFSVDMSKINSLEDQKDIIMTILSKKSKLLITCRKTVFNEALNLKSFALRKSVDLHEKTIDLDKNEKLNILAKHCKNEKVPKKMYCTMLFPKENIMIPLLCKLYSQNDRYQKLGKQFFEKPKQSLINELNNLQYKNSIQYAALVACLLNNNMLSERCFLPSEIKDEIYENCRLDQGTAKTKIIDALFQMEGSLIKLSENENNFTFIHDFIWEIVAYHYGNQFPNHIINYLSSGFIGNKIVVSLEDSYDKTVDAIDTSIKLDEEYFPTLANRLIKDMKSLEFFDVFKNKALFNPTFRKEVEKQLTDISYTELKSIIFFEHDFEKCREKLLRQIVNDMKVECSENLMDMKAEPMIQKLGSKMPYHVYESVFSKQQHFEIYRDELIHRVFNIMSNINFKNLTGFDIKDIERLWFKGNTYSLLVDIRANETGTSYHCRMVSWFVFYGHTDLLRRIIRYVIDNGDSVDIIFGTNPEENSRLLVLACISGNKDMIDLLLDYMESEIVNSSPTYIDTCLQVGMYTAFNDHRTSTPLTSCCRGGHFDTVKFLIEKWNANINLADGDFNTPLSLAVELGNEEIVEYLLMKGAKPDSMVSFKPTLLFTSARLGFIPIINLLLKFGSDVNLTCGNLKWTPMFIAAYNGNCGVVELLINNNANVNYCDVQNQTPLHIASNHGDFDSVSFIIKAGGDINKRANTNRIKVDGLVDSIMAFSGIGPFELPPDLYSLPLFDASSNGHSRVVSLLLKNGAEVNQYGPDHVTSLYIASDKGHEDIVSSLLRYCAEQSITNQFGISPLQIAILKNRREVIRHLVNAGNKIEGLKGSYHYFELLNDIVQAERYEEHHCLNTFVPDNLCSFIEVESAEYFSNLLQIGFDINRMDSKNRSLIQRIIFNGNVNDRLRKVRTIFRQYDSFRNKRDISNISLLERTRQQLVKQQELYVDMIKTRQNFDDVLNLFSSYLSEPTTQSREKEYRLYSNILAELKKGIRRYSV